MVDMGSGVLTRLREVIAPEALTHLVVTHLHPDHCVDLMGLEVYLVWGPGAGAPPLPVTGPPGLRERLIAFSGARGFDTAFAWSVLAPGAGEVDMGDGLVMRHREVPHLPPTNAVRFERDGAAICFSADCAYGDALPELAAGCDVLVCEATFGAGPPVEGVPHMTAAEAGRIAARAGVGRLLLTHLDPERDAQDALAQARGEFAGPVGLARPGEPVAL
jgi:ribonuclease BN (tRNA processing enzyme)